MDSVWNKESALRFGEALKRARKRAGFSQRSLSTASGISHTTIARLEKGSAGTRGKVVKPGPDTLIALAGALGRRPETGEDLSITRSVYRHLMGLAGYANLLYDPDDMIEFETANPEHRTRMQHDALRMSMELSDLIEGLKEAADNGRVGRDSREITLIAGILRSVLDSVDPGFEFHEAERGRRAGFDAQAVERPQPVSVSTSVSIEFDRAAALAEIEKLLAERPAPAISLADVGNGAQDWDDDDLRLLLFGLRHRQTRHEMPKSDS